LTKKQRSSALRSEKNTPERPKTRFFLNIGLKRSYVAIESQDVLPVSGPLIGCAVATTVAGSAR